MQRTYELMFIVRPDMLEEDQDKLISTLESAVTTSGGSVKSVEKMGKRRLAYDVKKFSEGQYVLFTLNADGKAIHELERRLRVAEQVIKFISVRTDVEDKRLAKVKKLRDSRVKGQGRQAAAAAEAAATAAANEADAEASPAQA